MKVVSLFSGAGGLDLGFKMAGHDIIWANDMYADAVETYKKNIGDHIICEDISKIKAEDIPDCDIIIGGFPCQGFSVANTKRHEEIFSCRKCKGNNKFSKRQSFSNDFKRLYRIGI